MAPMPGKVTLVTKDANGDGNPESSQALVDRTVVYPAGHPLAGEIKNPGFPFWIAGIEHTVGQRPTTPPLDMISKADAQVLFDDASKPLFKHSGFVTAAGGHDGGLPRHTLEGYAAGGSSTNTQNRLDFSKVVDVAKPVYFPEEGTDLEQAAMAFHAQRHHDTFLPDGTPVTGTSGFVTNGQPPVPLAMQEAAPASAGESLGEVLSPSQTNCFLECPAKWYFKYLRRLPEPKNACLALGIAVDEALCHNFRQKIETRVL